jgi:hypothetical protein
VSDCGKGNLPPTPCTGHPRSSPPFTAPAPRRYLGASDNRASISGNLRYSQLVRQLAGIALRDPTLILPLLGAAWRFRSRDWWRRAPFLPLPPAEYVEWRLHTAYGDDGAEPRGTELARYVRWAARMRKPRGH